MKGILLSMISGIVAFFIVNALINFAEFSFAGEIAVISLIALSIILIAVSMFRFQKLKTLNAKNFSGAEEDQVEDRKYKLFTDYSLCANFSFTLSILALSLSLIAAIAISTIYSFNSDDVQTFSIILMAVVLLIVNGRYLLAVRNK